jgi:two-component system, NtrC family, response regulator HydG
MKLCYINLALLINLRGKMKKNRLLEIIPCGVFVTDRAFNVHYVNKTMLELAGVTKNLVSRRGISAFEFRRSGGELMKPEDSDCLCRQGEKVIQRHLYLTKKEGGFKPVFISGISSPFESVDDAVVFCVTDLTRLEGCDILPANVSLKKRFHNIIGESGPVKTLYRHIELASSSDVTVLIAGESGTGKELVASAIHNESSRRKGPFIKVNCSSLVENLLESELFGHVKGSFTGAVSDRPGKFEAADGGTLFLDEIGDISLSTQVKLLRAVQERVVTRVGENRERKVDIRLVTATNRDLRQMVAEGKFREDLFFRLNVFPILTAPLRERGNDIILITKSIIEKLNLKYNSFITGISRNAMQSLMNHNWPGNIRELENALEYAFIFRKEGEITFEDLPSEISSGSSYKEFPLSQNLKSEKYTRAPVSREELAQLLKKYKFSRKLVAAHLGISTVALWKKMRKFNMLQEQK